MTDQFIVDTPEAVSFGYDIAGIGSRFMAALVDSLIIVSIQAIAGLVTIGIGQLSPDGWLRDELLPWVVAIVGLLAFAMLWGYYVLFDMLWNGQSPGKRWVGLRVIKETGAPISLVDSAIRNLVRLVDFLPMYYGIGVVTMFLNDRARRLGDLAAGTIVIRERKEVTLQSLTAAPAPSGAEPVDADLEGAARALTGDDYDLLVRFLQRREQLANRAGLALKLAAILRTRTGLPPEPSTPAAAEAFLLRLAAAYHARFPRESL